MNGERGEDKKKQGEQWHRETVATMEDADGGDGGARTMTMRV